MRGGCQLSKRAKQHSASRQRTTRISQGVLRNMHVSSALCKYISAAHLGQASKEVRQRAVLAIIHDDAEATVRQVQAHPKHSSYVWMWRQCAQEIKFFSYGRLVDGAGKRGLDHNGSRALEIGCPHFAKRASRYQLLIT